MSDHLPECIALAVRMEYDDAFCICPEIRLCEARVRASEFPLGVAVGKHDGFLEGYNAALDAAREAVAALPQRQSGVVMCVAVSGALAAIDALRGES